MTARTVARARLVLLGALALACTRDDPNPPLAPSFSLSSDPMLTGQLFGPDGSSNLCGFIPAGSQVRVRPIDLAAQDFGAAVNILTCPTNAFSFSVAPGSYLVRTILPPGDPGIGTFPVRTVEPVTIDGSDVTHDIVVRNGTALGGSATLDGAPLEGVSLTMVYDQAQGFLAADGGSGPDGAWTEGFRSPYILQNDVRYATGGCLALGVQALENAPPSFLFPSEVSAINCRFAPAPSIQFSHTHTRLVVTPMPGEIGGQASDLSDQYGIGWGVQFPVRPGQSPVHVPPSATHLFGGGLMIGIAPDHILSGINIAGQLQCGADCQDLGRDGVVSFTPQTPVGRIVTWRYSDAGSPEGVGLRIVQRSFDGRSPNDYVLFRFDIKNGGSSTVTFYAGVFMDWDVEEDATDDAGTTELGGTLMVVRSTTDLGYHMGTLLLGAPVSGNVFYNFSGDVPVPSSTADQYQALSGGMQQLTIEPGDAHYLHGVGPITLARGEKRTIWLAIVPGEDHDQLLANAAAAQADVARRQSAGEETAGGSLTVPTGRLGVPMRPLKKPGRLQ